MLYCRVLLILRQLLRYGSNLELQVINQLQSTIKDESGFTISEMLVSVLLSGIVLLTMTSQYASSVRLNHDQQIRSANTLQAQAILQTVGAEIRMIGNGVPFDQANFEIGENTLSDPLVTEPIVLSTLTANHIQYRINETGEVYLLTADFNPAGSLVVSLTDVSALSVNDPIYISNGVVSGDDGFYGIVEAVNSVAKTVTIAAGYVSSPGAVFLTGSVLEEVPVVTLNSPVDGSGVTRDSGFGAVSLGPKSTMSLEYLDNQGNVLSLPIDNNTVINTLRAVRVTITVTSTQNLSNGQPYVATAQQLFGIRNLNYFY